MKSENKHNWMIWAIIVLALMNISTFVTILIHNNRPGEITSSQLPEQGGSESTSLRYSGRYFRDQLGLNREQMSHFSEFNPEFRRNVRDINFSLASLRQRMIKEMAGETSDTMKLNELSDSIGHLHADLKKLTYKYYFDFRKICNKEQQETLEQMFGEMFAVDNQPGPGMHRSRYGRGYGRRLSD